jgi:hypothetical protein
MHEISMVKAEKAGLISDLAAIISALRQNHFRIPNTIGDELFGYAYDGEPGKRPIP